MGASKGDRYRQVDPKKYQENYEKVKVIKNGNKNSKTK